MTIEVSKESILVRRFYAAAVADFDRLIEAAATGDATAKLDLAMKMEKAVTQPPDHEPVFRQALAIYEELGNAGSVEAMERAVILYAEGATNSRITFEPGESPDTTTMVRSPVPDLTKAYQWCARAKEAGSVWAAETLPRIEQAIVDDVMNGPKL